MNPRTNGSGWAATAAKRSPLWWSIRHFGPYAVLTLTALLFAFALSVPGQPTWSTLGLWTLLTATETWAWRSRFGSTAARELMVSPSEIESPPSRPPEIVDAATELTPAKGATAVENGEQPSRAEPSDAEPSGAEPSSAEQARAEPSGAEQARAEPSRDAQAGEANQTDKLERADGVAEATEDITADTAEEDAELKPAELEPEELAECDESELLADGVGQQWTRGGNANDGEWIEAVMRVGLEAGQRHAVLHLTFCPPLTVVPTLHAYVVEGVPADVVVAERRVYGARLELRIKHPIAIASDAIVLARAETAPAALSSSG